MNLGRVRILAQYVTVGAAVLSAIVWAVTVATRRSGTLDGLQLVLGAVTVVGGVVMGLLFVLARRRIRNGGERPGAAAEEL